jgi:hypothetical protein
MKYLISVTGLLLAMPMNLPIAVAAAPSKCSTVLAQSKSALNKVNTFRISKIEQYEGRPPIGRSQHLHIIRGQRLTTEATMAKKIIANCPKIGSISFVTNGTDEEDRYGWLNGKVQPFKCKNIDEPVKWGEYGCP